MLALMALNFSSFLKLSKEVLTSILDYCVKFDNTL